MLVRVRWYLSHLPRTTSLIIFISTDACSTFVSYRGLSSSHGLKRLKKKKGSNKQLNNPCVLKTPLQVAPASLLTRCVCLNLRVKVSWTLSATEEALTFHIKCISPFHSLSLCRFSFQVWLPRLCLSEPILPVTIHSCPTYLCLSPSAAPSFSCFPSLCVNISPACSFGCILCSFCALNLHARPLFPEWPYCSVSVAQCACS